MAKLVEIPNVGTVEFPDDMSDEDIGSTIERDILPSYAKSETPAAQTPVAPVTPPTLQDIRNETFKSLNASERLSPSVQREIADPNSGIVGETLKTGKNLLGDTAANLGYIARLVGEKVGMKGNPAGFKSLNDAVTDEMDLKAARDASPKVSGERTALNELVQNFEKNGITDGREMMAQVRDSIKENVWDSTSNDDTRTLSDGTVRVNPKFIALPTPDEGIAAIKKASSDPAVVENFLAARSIAAQKLDEKAKTFDSGYRKHAAEMAAKGVTDPEKVFYSWDGLDRNWVEKSWDVVRDIGVETGRGLYRTSAGISMGIREGLQAVGIDQSEGLAADARKILASSEKSQFGTELATARGEQGPITGTAKELGTSLGQMAPMFAGGVLGRTVGGGAEATAAQQLLGAGVTGTSIYGWAGAQGYGSLMQSALEATKQKAEEEGREVTDAELVDTVNRNQVAALANGFQTAILAKLLPEGAEKVAAGGLASAAGQMTGREVLSLAAQKYGRDGIRAAMTAIKPELKSLAASTYTAAKVGFKDEALEEGLNQYIEGFITKVSGADADKTWDSIGQETFQGAWQGGIIGSALPAATQLLADRTPQDVAAQKLAAQASTVAPQSAAAAMEEPGFTGVDGNPISTEAPTLPIPEGFEPTTRNDTKTVSRTSETVSEGEATGNGPSVARVPTVETPVVQEPSVKDEEVLSEEDAAFIQERKDESTKIRREQQAAAGPVGERLNEIETKWQVEGVEVVPTMMKDSIEITVLQMPKGQRGQGLGSKVLDDFKSLAEESGKKITVLADDIAKTGRDPGPFYEKNGFTSLGKGKYAYSPTTVTPPAEKGIPEGVSETGIQPTPSEPAVAESTSTLGTPRPGFDNQFVTPEGAIIELTPDGKASFIVPPELRGEGVGNAAVERVKQHADATGTTIKLDIEPLGNEPGMNRAELANWYERRGFTVSPDRLSAEYVPGGAVEPTPAPPEPTLTVTPYSVESLKNAFNLTDEQAVVADAIRVALGARIDLVAKGGKPGSGALNQSEAQTEEQFNEEIRQQLDGKWDGLSPAGKAINLQRFAVARLAAKYPVQDDAGRQKSEGSHRIRIGGRGVDVQFDVRGDVESQVLVNPSTGAVSIVIGGKSFDSTANFNGSELASKVRIARVIEEEVIHAAERIAQLDRVGKADDYLAAADAEGAKVFDDILSSVKDPADYNLMVQAVRASFGVYNQLHPNSESMIYLDVASLPDANLSDRQKANVVGELVRQVIQLRKSGQITETSFQSVMKRMLDWLNSYLKVLKSVAAKPESLGPRFAQEVRDTEAVLASLETGDSTPLFQSSDAEYLAAVERGDMETAQRMVDEEARAAGYNMSHRQRSPDVKKTGDVLLFVDDTTSNTSYGSHDFVVKGLSEIPDYVKTFAFDYYGDEGQTEPEDILESAQAWDDRQFVSDLWQKYGDTFLDEGIVGFKTPDGAVVFDRATALANGQIKSADPVTRDADGNVIPLSQRFNPENSSILYQFAGESANVPQFMRDSLDTAKAMAAAGKPSEEIRAVTGWFPGKYDGKMRWEIPDAGATLTDRTEFNAKATEVYGGEVFTSLSMKSAVDRINAGKVLRLKDVLNHPSLYAAYPKAAEIPFFPIGGNIVNGSLRTIEGQKLITATLTTENGQLSEQSRSVILHEVQHFIQDVEGFSKGGSPDGLISRADIVDAAKFKDAYNGLNKYQKQLRSLTEALAAERSKKKGFMGFGGPDGKAIASLEAEIAKVQDAVNSVWEYQKKNLSIDRDSTRASLLSAINAVDNKLGSSWVVSNRNAGLDMLYKSLAGEIEARDVEARANMTPEQLKATAPYSSENIAPETAILLFQGPKASFEIVESGKILLRGLQNPDFTSAVHEIAHAARRSMAEVLTEKEVRIVEQWAGVKNGKWARRAEEKWARGWERYFAEGKAPIPRLQAIYDKIAGWMAQVYRNIKGSDIDVEITPEVRAIMDKLAARMEIPETVTAEMVEDVENDPDIANVVPVEERGTRWSNKNVVGNQMQGSRTVTNFAIRPKGPVVSLSDSWNQPLRAQTYLGKFDTQEDADAAAKEVGALYAVEDQEVDTEAGEEEGHYWASFDDKDAAWDYAVANDDLPGSPAPTEETQPPTEPTPPEFGNPPVDESQATEPLPPEAPLPELPNFSDALDDDSVTGLYHAQTDADRARMGLPPRFKQPRTTDQAAWDRATAAEDAHRAAGKPGTAGTDLLTNLLSDVPRVLTKDEHALLLHEKLVREQAVEAAQRKLNDLPAGTPDGVRKNAQAVVKAAQDAFDELITYVDAAGSRAGLSLQARKMLVHTDFTLAAVVNRLRAAKNMNLDSPAEWTEKDQQNAVAIATKLQEAQERVAYLEDALNSQNEEVRRQAELVEQLTKDVERAQSKLEIKMRSSRARNLVRAKLDPLVEAAKARRAARNGTDTDVLFQSAPTPTPEMAEDLKDVAIIAAGWFVDKTLSLGEFSSMVVKEFGDKIAEFAQDLFNRSRAIYIETAESVTEGNTPTPESVVKGIDGTEPLDKSDVWKLARAYVVAGKRGSNVLDAVFGDLSAIFPDITRDDVAQAFTGYGEVVYPSDKAVPAELRRIRSLEREYLKQLDIAAGQIPKRTGYQGDVKKGPEWVEVRAEQQKTAEALRELENQLREAGLPVPSDERKLANALETSKRRLTNEIEEIQLALDTKTPRAPRTRAPLGTNAEIETLKARLKQKQAEYDQVFKDETARERRILGSIKKRKAELERRMREKDFSTKERLAPVNTEASRKAQYEFDKTRSEYEEMRTAYMRENAPLLKKAGNYAISTGNLLKLMVLGMDLGVVMRQLGTTFQAVTRDLGMLAPTVKGARLRADGSYLKRIFSAGMKAIGSREYEHAAFERLMARDMAGWDKISGLVLNAPFDIQRNSKEDIPPANLLDEIPWWVWPSIAAVKVSMLGASFPVSATILALGVIAKPTLQALDRAQRVMTNESRAMFFDEAMRAIHDGNPSVAEAKALAKAVMVGTGRGSAPHSVESAIPLLNQFILATRYYLSRIQALTLYPLFNKDARTSTAAQKQIAKMYGRSVTGRALLITLAAMAFGKSLGGDDDEPEEGLILNPLNLNFLRLKVANGVSMDFMSGLNNFASIMARYAMAQRVDPKTGEKIALGAGFSNNINDEVFRFLSSKLNIQFSFAVNTRAGQYFGGKPATPANMVEEITTAIIINDTMKVYQAMIEDYGPTVGAARATLFLGIMFGGAGTSVQNSEAEKETLRLAKKEAEWERKARQAELNE